MVPRALLVWLGLLVTAVLNGALREAVLVPALGAAVAHVVSTVLLSVAILVVARLTTRWIGPRTTREAAALGALWLVLTLVFELGFGRARGASWRQLLADYDLLRGRVWPLVLGATAVGPWLAFRAHSRREGR